MKWNLKPLTREKRKELEQKSYKFINKWKNRKDYLEKPVILKRALDEYEQWQRFYGTTGKEWYYFWLQTQQDQNNPILKAKFNKIDNLRKKIQNDIQFFTLRIAKIPPENQQKFLNYKGLKEYKHFLEKLFAESKYLLSELEEKIITLKSGTSYSNWVKMTAGFLSKEERERKSFSEILSLLDSKDKKMRDLAAENINDILKNNSDIAEIELNSVLDNKKIDDELRKISRPDLSRHISDDLDSKIIDVLISAVSQKFGIAKKYYELKVKLMNVKKLKYHERNVPYGKIDKKYSYEEAVGLIYRVLGKINKKFADIFNNFVENGQIDVYPRKNKTGGAFCAYNLISQPVYILLNYTNKFNDVLTLAHELGHGINDELMKRKQNALNFGTPLSTAEVASTFIEDFVLEEILKGADDDLKLAIMMMKLNGDISTIFRQIACYKFEQELHQEFRKRGYLSKKEIGKMFQKHMASYMGKFVEQSAGSENWWIYWSHIRRYFYNYSYASGLLISKSLRNSAKNNPKFIDRVEQFLSTGLSDSPKNIFRKLGINIADKKFWNNGLKEVEILLKNTTELAKKLGKI